MIILILVFYVSYHMGHASGEYPVADYFSESLYVVDLEVLLKERNE
ncbi:hypothetical protein NVV94_17205 [Pseudomonas sp. LS1212]|nr:hypothetical protein [Pseudomonas sp. LS1212]UVJ42369.1 hypothetical protein NVV94_17205 [Pseudomonas sp. LS1212]